MEFDILPTMVGTLRHYRMLEQGEGVVIGVSGGVDSIALLHGLWRLRVPWDLQLYIAHLNHGIRGEAADQDYRLVKEFGAELDIPVFGEALDIPAWAKARGLTEEEAGRKARYGQYARIADQTGAPRIAVGHHGDDQAETVLMNLIRGAGLRGLAGIPPVRGKVIRPLYDLRKWQLEAYCRWQRLPWREDVTNLSKTYRRNYIRWEIMPKLTGLNPNAVGNIVHTAKTLEEDRQVLEELAREHYHKALQRRDEDSIALSRPALQVLPAALRKRVIAYAHGEVSGTPGSLPGVSLEQTEAFFAPGTEGKTITLPGAIAIYLREEVLILAQRVKIKQEAVLPKYELRLDTSTVMAEVNMMVSLEVVDEVTRWWEAAAAVNPGEVWREDGLWWADLDLDSLKLPLSIRGWLPGDRMQPLGMNGSKKLQDIFVDAKIPRRARGQVPCVVDGQGIIAVVGVRQSQRTRVTDETTRILRLTARNLT